MVYFSPGKKLNPLFRILLLFVGWVSLAVGIVGIFLPLLPTTPFLILTAFCFAHGSEKLYRKLISIPAFGKPINEWHEHGIIRRRAKWVATFAICIGGVLVWIRVHHMLAITVTAILCGSLLFIWSRPEEKQL